MKNIITIGMLILALVFSVNAMASEVIQGECLAYDASTNIVKVKEFDTNFSKEFKYGRPTANESELDLSNAQIGMKPEPKDILRIAYKVDGSKKVGLKVMNVSKQDLMKK